MNIEASSITVRYGRHTVLDNVSHVFEEGKIHCLLGSNGCGKTTLIKALVNKYAQTKDISYVPQELFGQVALSVYDTVALGRYDASRFFTGMTKDDRDLIDSAIDRMKLNGLEDRIFDTLSGGEKQRVMVARALAQDTGWMFLDEPASNLDVKHTKIIMDTFADLKKEKGRSFIIVVHDVNIASKYADSCLLMKDGKLLDTTEELTAEQLGKIYDTSFGQSTTVNGQTVFFPY